MSPANGDSKFSFSGNIINPTTDSLVSVVETPNVTTIQKAQGGGNIEDVDSIKSTVGGDEEYGKIVNWAADNLSKDVIESFDDLISTGNIGAIKLAVNGMKAQYEDANGYEGRMLTGKAPQTSGDVFRSQPELVAAMSDPRYDSDPAYRQDIMQKLDRSDLQF